MSRGKPRARVRTRGASSWTSQVCTPTTSRTRADTQTSMTREGIPTLTRTVRCSRTTQKQVRGSARGSSVSSAAGAGLVWRRSACWRSLSPETTIEGVAHMRFATGTADPAATRAPVLASDQTSRATQERKRTCRPDSVLSWLRDLSAVLVLEPSGYQFPIMCSGGSMSARDKSYEDRSTHRGTSR